MNEKQRFDREISAEGTTVEQAGLDLSRMIYMMFNHLDMQVSIADNKASIVVAINTVMLTGVGLSQPTIQEILQADPVEVSGAVALVLLFGMLMSSLASILYAIDAARPKLIPPDVDGNLFFFGAAAQMDGDAYERAFLDENVQTIKRNIFRQIHARSKVVATKFAYVRRSMNLLFLAVMLWSVAQVLLAV